MKLKTNIIACAILFLMFSCKSGKNENAEQSATTPLFKVIMVSHPVANFDAWKTVYLTHDSVREVYGISKYALARGMEDSNLVIIMNKFTDLQKAKEFASLPNLKETMEKAGVTGQPTFSYADVIRNDDSKTDIKDRVMVSHHVKDFNAWLKVFDAEGPQTRAANGLVDRGLARDCDDPNKVYVVFAIADMEKAKARMASEDLKKIMTDAGVDGPPTFMFYRLVE